MSGVDVVVAKSNAEWFATRVLGWTPDAKQAAVLLESPKRLILNCTRQWGKSTLTAVKAVHHAWSNPESLVLVAGPSERQASLLVSKARRFVRGLYGRVRGDGENRRSILFPNGSRIIAVPAREDTIVGFSAVSLLVIDEAARVQDDLYDAVTPMLAVSKGSIWMLSTPMYERGFFYETWTRGGPKWRKVSVKATECPRIDPEFLAEERERRTERRFARDYMCEFAEDGGRLFSSEVVRGMFE